MDREMRVGPVIRSMNNLLMRKMDSLAVSAGEDATVMVHGWILGYLHSQEDREIYQKDIEKEFKLSKAAVTCIIKALEEKGCIKRENVKFDARLKKIVLLPKGIEVHKKSFENVKIMESILVKDIDEKDLAVFLKVSTQMKKNMLEAE